MVGCASTKLTARAPRDVDLGGEWQIDLALSDFPNEAVTPLDASSAPSTEGAGQGGGRHGGGRGGGRGMGGGGMQGGMQGGMSNT